MISYIILNTHLGLCNLKNNTRIQLISCFASSILLKLVNLFSYVYLSHSRLATVVLIQPMHLLIPFFNRKRMGSIKDTSVFYCHLQINWIQKEDLHTQHQGINQSSLTRNHQTKKRSYSRIISLTNYRIT